MILLLACAEPACPDGEVFDQDGLCVPDTGAETDADTDADTDTDSDSDSDSDTDTDTGTYPFDLYVCPTGKGGDYATIQEGVDAAAPGQVVGVCPAWYHECVTIGKDLTLLSSSGGDTTWVDGDEVCPSVTVTSGTVTLDGLSLVHGTAALVVDGADVTAVSLYYRDHLAEDAVVVVASGSFTTERGWFSDNLAEAAIRLGAGTLTVHATEFDDDLGDDVPVELLVEAGTAEVSNTKFFGAGAGVHVSAAVPVTISNSTFVLDAGSTGVVSTDDLLVQNSIFTGPGIGVSGPATIRYTDFWEVDADRCVDEACGPSEGEGVIHVDPELVDGGRRLAETSACVDMGDPDPAWNDVDGSRNDLGASGGPGGE